VRIIVADITIRKWKSFGLGMRMVSRRMDEVTRVSQ
jgi:hypothetical protein